MNSARLAFCVSRVLLVLTAFLCALPSWGRPPRNVNRDLLIQQDFQNRVAEYLKLRRTIQAGLPKPKQTGVPDKITKHEHELARRIRDARPHAKQGDLLTDEISAEFRRLIGIMMRGSEAVRIRESLKSAEPVRLQLRVNDEYPGAIPLQSTPPTLLETLPKLPPELDYRFAGHDLLLRDAGANIIVDFIIGALP